MGTQQRRQREAAQRRQAILASARKLFWQRGYAGTTMPQIASDADLAPGTLYLYFPGKSALYAALLEEGYDMLEQRLERAAAEAASPGDRAEALVAAFLAFARDNPQYFDVIFFILQSERRTWQRSLPAAQVRYLTDRESACKDLVARALNETSYVPAAAVQPAVEAIWSMLAGVVLFFKNDECFGEVAAEAQRLLLRAVLTQT